MGEVHGVSLGEFPFAGGENPHIAQSVAAR
jgi:hypothetical protein